MVVTIFTFWVLTYYHQMPTFQGIPWCRAHLIEVDFLSCVCSALPISELSKHLAIEAWSCSNEIYNRDNEEVGLLSTLTQSVSYLVQESEVTPTGHITCFPPVLHRFCISLLSDVSLFVSSLLRSSQQGLFLWSLLLFLTKFPASTNPWVKIFFSKFAGCPFNEIVIPD